MKPTMTRTVDGYLDPVFVDSDSGKWYFYEETWAYYQGPFKTEEECRIRFDEYCKYYL